MARKKKSTNGRRRKAVSTQLFTQPMTSHARDAISKVPSLEEENQKLWGDRHFLLTVMRSYGILGGSDLPAEAKELLASIVREDAMAVLREGKE